MFTKGTALHSMYRGVLVFFAFGVTTMMAGNPEWATVTVGSIAAAFVHYIATLLEA